MAIAVPDTQNFGTKLTGPEMAEGVQAATVTAVNDLGEQPNFEKNGTVHTIEFVFEGKGGSQIKKTCKLSGHEKSFISQLVLAATGKQVTPGQDLEALTGSKVTLAIVRKPSKSGKMKSYISTVLPAMA